MPKTTPEISVVQSSFEPIRASTGAPGSVPGAPVMARMGYKLLWTTLISAVVFGIGMWAYYQGYLNIERLSKLMGLPF